jgi:hypothetical protein
MPEPQEIVETVDKLPVPKSSFIWLKDSSGFPSVSVTLVAVSFYVTTLSYVLSCVHSIGSFEFRQFDVAACGAYFIPILTMYVSRRFTDAKFGIIAPQPPLAGRDNK